MSTARKLHPVGSSLVVTVAPEIIKTLGLDELTFLDQDVQPDGSIIMRPQRLTSQTANEKKTSSGQPATDPTNMTARRQAGDPR